MKNSTLLIAIATATCFLPSTSKAAAYHTTMHATIATAAKPTYRQAINADVSSLVELINTQACKDADKIVVVPKKFRSAYVEGGIKDKRVFVADQGGTIIGYKKLFCIDDTKERDDILHNELRLKTAAASCATMSLPQRQVTRIQIPQQLPATTTYLYTGADFTHPAYRNHDVNRALTTCALTTAKAAVINHMKTQHSSHLALVYGLTEGNAGNKDDLLGGRSQSLANQFIPFAQAIAKDLKRQEPKTLLLSRHTAFKPSFDPDDTECKPLPDNKAIPGYGCVISCELTTTN